MRHVCLTENLSASGITFSAFLNTDRLESRLLPSATVSPPLGSRVYLSISMIMQLPRLNERISLRSPKEMLKRNPKPG